MRDHDQASRSGADGFYIDGLERAQEIYDENPEAMSPEFFDTVRRNLRGHGPSLIRSIITPEGDRYAFGIPFRMHAHAITALIPESRGVLTLFHNGRHSETHRRTFGERFSGCFARCFNAYCRRIERNAGRTF